MRCPDEEHRRWESVVISSRNTICLLFHRYGLSISVGSPNFSSYSFLHSGIVRLPTYTE